MKIEIFTLRFQDKLVEELMVDDLKELLFTSMQSMVSRVGRYKIISINYIYKMANFNYIL